MQWCQTFIIIKLQKHLDIIKIDKYYELSHLMLLDWSMKFVCLIIAGKVVNNARFRRGYHFELRPIQDTAL